MKAGWICYKVARFLLLWEERSFYWYDFWSNQTLTAWQCFHWAHKGHIQNEIRADAPVLNVALNKVQPAAILHIPVHFGSYAGAEAAEPFLKLTGERTSTTDHQWREGQDLELHTPDNQTAPTASVTLVELKIWKGIPLLLCTPKQQKAMNKHFDERRINYSEARPLTSCIFNLNTAPLWLYINCH